VTRHERLFAIGSVVICVALYAGLRPFFEGALGGAASGTLIYGLLVSFAVVAASFVLMRRALRSSNRFFQIAFVGGFLGRLLLLGVAIAIAFLVSGLNGPGAAIAMVAAFLPLMALEVYCVVRGRASRRPGGRARREDGGPSDGR
jgi:hypothetical protein